MSNKSFYVFLVLLDIKLEPLWVSLWGWQVISNVQECNSDLAV